MSKLESLYRQNEIIKLVRKGPFDWEMLERHLDTKSADEQYRLSISKRTLNRDLNEIDQFFGLCIQFDFKIGKYNLMEDGSSEENTWLLESFDLIQAFQFKKGLKNKVLFEKRLAMGTEYLKPILQAIEAANPIRITYEKYWLWEKEERILKPMALKEFKHRWYVLVWDEKDHFKVFGLDRIRELSILYERTAFPPTPDLEDHFGEVIGIINDPNEPVENIILTFSEFKGRYIKSMPWHPSQQILVDDGNILTISLQVKINYELISEILSHGDEVRVDGPERLREMVKEKARNIVSSIS